MGDLSNPGLSQAQLDAAAASNLAIMATLIPPASTITPPGIGTSGSVGATSTSFARADHTHASSVQRTRATTITGGVFTWTFSPAYPTGITPVVTYGVENTTGSDFPYVVNITSISNLSVTFQVYKVQQPTLGGNVLNVANITVSPVSAKATSGLALHCWAALPTQ